MLGKSRARRLVVVPLLTGACHSWSTVPISPNTSGPLPRHSTVVMIGGRRVQVDDGLTTRDSLFGARVNGARFAVPRDSVAYVETRKVNVLNTVGAGAAGLVIGVVVLGFVALLVALSEFQ